MEHSTSVDIADEFGKGDDRVNSKKDERNSDEHESADCNISNCSKTLGLDDDCDQEASNCSKILGLHDDCHQEVSDCSKTLGLDDDCHQEVFVSRFNLRTADLMVDESIDTTWTNRKHSSYLDSMETTFVRKMYDKEYCSVDVCGHSSNSSIDGEQDCVESHPFCLNMRKPYERVIGPPFKASTGSWFSTSSLLASPWIQHFKSKQGILAKNSYMSKKRDALLDAPDSPRSSHGTTSGGFKKLKCQQDLSHLDMKMEEQYNAEQQVQESHHQDENKA